MQAYLRLREMGATPVKQASSSLLLIKAARQLHVTAGALNVGVCRCSRRAGARTMQPGPRSGRASWACRCRPPSKQRRHMGPRCWRCRGCAAGSDSFKPGRRAQCPEQTRFVCGRGHGIMMHPGLAEAVTPLWLDDDLHLLMAVSTLPTVTVLLMTAELPSRTPNARTLRQLRPQQRC